MKASYRMQYLPVIIGACAMLTALPANADSGKSRRHHEQPRYEDHDNDRGHGHGKDRDNIHWDKPGNNQRIFIGSNDRNSIKDYYRFRKNAWHKSKVYIIGAPIPRYVTYYDIPPNLVARLQPIPRGYKYVRVDNDVLLIAEATKQVIDAVTLLSSVNR